MSEQGNKRDLDSKTEEIVAKRTRSQAKVPEQPQEQPPSVPEGETPTSLTMLADTAATNAPTPDEPPHSSVQPESIVSLQEGLPIPTDEMRSIEALNGDGKALIQ